MQVKSIAECFKGSILQYFLPSLRYHFSLRSWFCLFLSCPYCTRSLITVDISFWFDTLHLGKPIWHIEGPEVIPNKIAFLSLKIVFVIANSVDSDEMPHYVAFHLGLNWLPKYSCQSQ